ncbi:glycosyltransferase [Corticibacterium sp. UT-5YL-CI-8]|nr:glycosyltransferase [Tianweitania sp. UT-5YL-CI-8]
MEAVRLLVASGRSDLRCRIVGEGEDRPDLAAQIEASGLAGHIELVGPLPQADVKAAMRDATLLACPCIVGEDGNRDGMPTVLPDGVAPIG